MLEEMQYTDDRGGEVDAESVMPVAMCSRCGLSGYSNWSYKCSIPSHRMLAKMYDDLLYHRRTIGSGSFRTTFASKNKNFVIKFPRNRKGFRDNATEAFAYKKWLRDPKSLDFVPAACRLTTGGLLVMEKLENTGRRGYDRGVPEWVNNLNDGGQVGTNKKGEIKAYDFAHNFDETVKELKPVLRSIRDPWKEEAEKSVSWWAW